MRILCYNYYIYMRCHTIQNVSLVSINDFLSSPPSSGPICLWGKHAFIPLNIRSIPTIWPSWGTWPSAEDWKGQQVLAPDSFSSSHISQFECVHFFLCLLVNLWQVHGEKNLLCFLCCEYPERVAHDRDESWMNQTMALINAGAVQRRAGAKQRRS